MEVDSPADDPEQGPDPVPQTPSRRRRRDPEADSELEHTPSKTKRTEDPDPKEPALPEEPSSDEGEKSRSRSVSPEFRASDIYNRLFVPKYSAEPSSYSLVKVDVPGDSRYLCELKIGPPSRVDLSSVPNNTKRQLHEYNSMGRKMIDQLTHYRDVSDFTSRSLVKFRSEQRKLDKEKVESVIQHVEELEDVVLSLVLHVSKANRNFNVCFCYAGDINKIYHNLKSVPPAYHEEQLDPVAYHIDIFRRGMRKAHSAIRIAGLRDREIAYLESAIRSVLDF